MLSPIEERHNMRIEESISHRRELLQRRQARLEQRRAMRSKHDLIYPSFAAYRTQPYDPYPSFNASQGHAKPPGAPDDGSEGSSAERAAASGTQGLRPHRRRQKKYRRPPVSAAWAQGAHVPSAWVTAEPPLAYAVAHPGHWAPVVDPHAGLGAAWGAPADEKDGAAPSAPRPGDGSAPAAATRPGELGQRPWEAVQTWHPSWAAPPWGTVVVMTAPPQVLPHPTSPPQRQEPMPMPHDAASAPATADVVDPYSMPRSAVMPVKWQPVAEPGASRHARGAAQGPDPYASLKQVDRAGVEAPA